MTGLSQFWTLQRILWTTLIIAALGGCMTVSSQQVIVEKAQPSQAFANKMIAILPVKTQTSLAPDSVASIRSEINKRLFSELRQRLATASLIDTTMVANQMNEKNVLPVFEQFVATYENTGVIDKQKISTLGRAFGADYLLLSRLKAERLDIVISRATGTSLETSLINANSGEVEWGGASEWKRGGIFGFGEAKPAEIAAELVTGAFSSLK